MYNFGNLAPGGIQRSYSFPYFVEGRLNGTLSMLQGPDQPSENVLLKAPSTNTGVIYIGGNNVSSTIGFPLDAGDSVLLPIKNLNLVYYVGTVAADSLRYIIWR